MRRFDGKTIVILGGATGIGAATALRIAGEGGNVAIGDINDESAQAVVARIRAEGGSALAQHANLGDGESLRNLFDTAAAQFGGIDGLANIALALDPRDTDILTLDLAAFDDYMRTNLKGYLTSCQLAIPHLLQRGGGAIVQVSSLAGQYGGAMGSMPLYGMYKAGIDALTRHIVARLGKQNIRCNSVAPGTTLTELIRTHFDQIPDMHRMLDQVPRPRFAEPEELAGVIAFLLSADGGAVNGQTIYADGGQAAVMFPIPG